MTRMAKVKRSDTLVTLRLSRNDLAAPKGLTRDPPRPRPTLEEAVRLGYVTAAEFDRLVRPEKMIRPG